MSGLRKVQRALISLSDKSGAEEFAQALAEMGVKIISTGGTAKALRDSGIEVTDVADVTGFPEMMDGRVKTLHPKIHGGFLALRDNPEHVGAMRTHGIEPIDLVVVNLYPFEETIAKEGVRVEEAVENIDIGGPAMIRSASKNWRDVAVVTDPRLYDGIIEELRSNEGALSLQTRQRLAALAYTRTAAYDLRSRLTSPNSFPPTTWIFLSRSIRSAALFLLKRMSSMIWILRPEEKRQPICRLHFVPILQRSPTFDTAKIRIKKLLYTTRLKPGESQRPNSFMERRCRLTTTSMPKLRGIWCRTLMSLRQQ